MATHVILNTIYLVGIGGGEYRSVRKKRRVEGGEWRVEGEEVWSVQESGSEKIIKNLSSVAKFFFQNFIRFCQFFTTKKFLGLKLLPPEKYMINPMFFNHKKVKIKDGLHRL